ncbi:MAG: Xaa-Pro peptidase family protein [Candidatus Bathyarchaeota archaeon]|nr:Xaa-Pro peptidase family protein [Candidatus Bathyarchaeota archaeon]
MNTGFKLDKARSLMEEKNLDCVLATSHDNVYYCSNSEIMTITMLKRLAAVFIPLDGEPVFGVHANERVTAEKTTWIKDLRVYEGGEWEPLKPIDFVAETLEEMGYNDSRIGVETLDIPGVCYDYLRKLLPDADFTDSQPVFDKMRAVKSPEEFKHLSNINMATAKAITVAFEMAKPGDTEKEIAQNMITQTLEYGADTVAFMTMGARKNIWETHHIPGDYKIKEGDLIHVDFGCFFDGYLSDISRMAVVGRPDEIQLEAYRFAVDTERATGEALKPGVTVMEVHNAVKEFYEARGHIYNRAFIGHGLGIGCHEYPFLGPSHADWILEPDMFFQVEPSIALGHARVHTEDSFVITKKGSENVSEYRDIYLSYRSYDEILEKTEVLNKP